MTQYAMCAYSDGSIVMHLCDGRRSWMGAIERCIIIIKLPIWDLHLFINNYYWILFIILVQCDWIEMASNKSIEFVYAFLNGSQQCTLKAPLSIPLDHPVCELTLRLIKAHNLPCHIQAGTLVFIKTVLNWLELI